MLIISDTSPIINLTVIGHLDLLPKLFGEIIIPQMVYAEIVIDGAGEPGSDEIQNAPWIKVVKNSNRTLVEFLETDLDEGESEAIALAIELNADYLLIDEKLGRQMALNHNIKPLGILGVLLRAKQAKMIDSVTPLMDRLRTEAVFFIHQSLYDFVKQQAGE